ncbi:MAG: TrkH family potassium uptake protein [Bacilli bacterium]|nr:TrkH family potassium uptake protein [Bacilli bacterium]
MIRKPASGHRLIFGYLGFFLILIGAICLLPLLLLLLPKYQSEAGCAFDFLIPGLTAIGGGIGLSFLIFKRDKMQLGKFQDCTLLVLIWFAAILVGAVPFLLRGVFTGNGAPMNFTAAIFESTSGYSSSGLTLFNFDDSLPGYHLFTMYRSLLLFFGGIGLVLIVTSALSDRYGLKLYTAEGHNDKLVPNLVKSARLILAIYAGYILLGTLSYFFIGGLSLFDAFNHSIAAVATGGFSTRAGGLPEIIEAGGVNQIGIPIHSVAINITSVVLMVLGATNFVLHLFLFTGKIKAIAKDLELRFFGIMTLIFVPLFFFAVLSRTKVDGSTVYTPVQALGEGTFLFFTSVTTTGFSAVYEVKQLGEAAIILSIIMMCVGGGMGSTAGAIKQYRLALAFKSFYWSLRDRLAPANKVYPHSIYRLGVDKEVQKDEVYESYGYIIIYIAALFTGTILIVILGKGYITGSDALFEFASALSGTGLSVGVTGFSTAINWVLIFGMFIGRLEILPVYFAFFRLARDILRKETI